VEEYIFGFHNCSSAQRWSNSSTCIWNCSQYYQYACYFYFVFKNHFKSFC